MNHKAWLDNEYNLWIEALEESTVDNFHDNPMVKRMLGEVEPELFLTQAVIKEVRKNPLLIIIDNIGRETPLTTLSGACLRMVYYALQVLDQNPKSIVEIGGGVGQFYAVLRALGYKGEYFIYDLPQVQQFQWFYLTKVNLLTGLNTKLDFFKHEFCVSFYSLGEFDKDTKEYYIPIIVNACPHGFIIWNPHSGADAAINFKHNVEVKPENPLTLEGNLQVTW